MTRRDLDEKSFRSLLRQALVAACAAVETFSADRVMERYSEATKGHPVPHRLLSLPITVGDWLEIERRYERRKWGLREVGEFEVRQQASPAPPGIGKLFAMVGERDLWKRITSVGEPRVVHQPGRWTELSSDETG